MTSISFFNRFVSGMTTAGFHEEIERKGEDFFIERRSGEERCSSDKSSSLKFAMRRVLIALALGLGAHAFMPSVPGA